MKTHKYIRNTIYKYIRNTIYILSMISSFIFSVNAALLEKSDGIADYVVVVMLWCLVFAPPVLLSLVINYFDKRKNYSKSYFGEVTQIIVCVVVIAIVTIWGYMPDDVQLLMPWVMILVVNIIQLILKSHR